MLGSHGLFTWGDTAYESYVNTLDVIEICSAYLAENYGKKGPVFGGQKIASATADLRKKTGSHTCTGFAWPMFFKTTYDWTFYR